MDVKRHNIELAKGFSEFVNGGCQRFKGKENSLREINFFLILKSAAGKYADVKSAAS